MGPVQLFLLLTISVSFNAAQKYYKIEISDTRCNGTCQITSAAKWNCCCSFNDAFNSIREITSNIEILIKLNTSAEEVLVIPNKTNIVIKGQSAKHIDIHCVSNISGLSRTGFVFDSVSNLRLQNLRFVGCGFWNESKYGNYWKTPVAILIRNCTNVTIINVEVSHSLSLGLLISNVIGHIKVKDSNFSHNNATHTNLTHFSLKGGGLAISYKGNNKCDGTDYDISGCRFENNSKSGTSSSHGGGMWLSIYETEEPQTFHIRNCSFIGNKAENGGGAAIHYKNCINSHVEMNDVLFQENVASGFIISNGGGLQIIITSKNYSNNAININDCNFTNNTAYFGGGFSIDSAYSHKENRVIITNCTWTENTATSGSAVDISRHFPEDLHLNHPTVRPVFVNCSFIRNRVTFLPNITNNTFEVGYGAVSVVEVNTEFQSSVQFVENLGSALCAITSIITFNCSALFLNNNGTFGGAVLLNFASLLIDSPGAEIHFEGNKAKLGGAIFSFVTDDHMLFSQSLCPILIRYNNSYCDVSITFTNNTAKAAGSSIYLPSLLPCRFEYSPNFTDLINSTEVFHQKHFHFTNRTAEQEVATAPKIIMPFNGSMTVYPGAVSHLNLTLKDELNNPIPNNLVIFEATIPNEASNDVYLKDAYIYNCSFTLFGQENTVINVQFQTLSVPLKHIVREIKIDSCPPGFKWSNSQCVCDRSSFYGIKKCNSAPDDFSTSIATGIWGGYVLNQSSNEKVFVSAPCSFFCKQPENDHHLLRIPSNLTQHPDFACKEHRTGVLCGKCKPGYTTYYHTNTHYTCELDQKFCQLKGLFLFIASEIIPITLLFIVIILTGFDVTNGYVQGFLLYSHILCTLPITRAIKMPKAMFATYDDFVRALYFPLMLKFFYFKKMSFCILSNANNLDMAALGYIKGLYCVFLIAAIVFFLKCFSRYCHCCNRFLRFTTAKNSALIGISALFVLFFMCAAEISFIILQPAPLYGKGYNVLNHRVAFYGEIIYFSSKHMKYAVPAIFFLVVLLVPMFMLLFYPLVTSCLSYYNIDASESWKGYILTVCFMHKQLKPLYDRFYTSFKDKHRYFAGFYFLYRVLIEVTYYIPNYIESAFIMETLLISFLVLHTIMQPHQNMHHNTIDTLLLSNLVIINGLICVDMIIIYDSVHDHFWKTILATNCQAFLVVLPMLVALSYVAWKYVLRHLWIKTKQRLDCCSLLVHRRRSGYQMLHSDRLAHRRQVSLHNHSN